MEVREALTSTVPSTDTQSQPLKPLWSSVVQQKLQLSKHVLNVSVSADGSPMVDVPDEILQGATPLWEDFLIGKFLDKAPHIAKVHVIVNKICNFGNKMVKVDAFVVNDNTMKFRIRDSSARTHGLRRGMWNIADIPMVVLKWSPIVEETKPAL